MAASEFHPVYARFAVCFAQEPTCGDFWMSFRHVRTAATFARRQANRLGEPLRVRDRRTGRKWTFEPQLRRNAFGDLVLGR